MPSGIALLLLLLSLSSAAWSQIPDSPAAVVADIPVNYTEAASGNYTLPDPLKLSNGQPVKDAATWQKKATPMHDGGHGTVPSDFEVYIRFMKMHLLHPASSPSTRP